MQDHHFPTGYCRKHPLAAAIIVMLAGISLVHFYLATKATMGLALGYQDTQIFVDAARRLATGGKLYPLIEPLYVTYAPGMSVFKFSPLYIVPYMPWLDIVGGDARDTVYRGLYAVNVARYCIAAWLLFWFFGSGRTLPWAATIVIIFGLASPIFECLFGMTFESLLLCALVLTMVCLDRQWTWTAAGILSYVMLAKLYPVIFCLYFFTKQRWGMVVKIAITGAAWIAVSILVIGVESHIDYYTKILPVLLHEDANIGPNNISLVYTLLDKETLRKSAVAAIVLASIAVLNVSEMRRQQNADSVFPMEFAFIVSSALLLFKNVWMPYQISLLIPVAVLAGSGLARQGAARFFRLGLALLAFIPLLDSRQYPTLGLEYYTWIMAQPWFSQVNAWLSTGRLYNSALLWLATGGMLLWDAYSRKTALKQQSVSDALSSTSIPPPHH